VGVEVVEALVDLLLDIAGVVAEAEAQSLAPSDNGDGGRECSRRAGGHCGAYADLVWVAQAEGIHEAEGSVEGVGVAVPGLGIGGVGGGETGGIGRGPAASEGIEFSGSEVVKARGCGTGSNSLPPYVQSIRSKHSLCRRATRISCRPPECQSYTSRIPSADCSGCWNQRRRHRCRLAVEFGRVRKRLNENWHGQIPKG
jgi:hypothetical protein